MRRALTCILPLEGLEHNLIIQGKDTWSKFNKIKKNLIETKMCLYCFELKL